MTTIREWADFFNGYATKYETHDFTKNTQAEVDFLIAELGLTPGQSVLDVGCGTGRHSIELAKRGFVPTELVLLFTTAGLEVQSIWGGTAGNWGKRDIELDEMEIMVVGRKA